MDTRDLNEKGLKLRREMFGDEAVDKRMKAFGAFGEPLQHIINAYAYGDVWSRPTLTLTQNPSPDGDRSSPRSQHAGAQRMDTRDLNEKGLKLRSEMFGDEAVDKRMKAFGAFGEPLQHIINAYAYGDVWSRPALPLATKSLAMVAMMAGAGRTNELRVHVKGALTNGCSAEQIQDILLLVAMYCGIPAANEAHRIAVDVLRETEAK